MADPNQRYVLSFKNKQDTKKEECYNSYVKCLNTPPNNGIFNVLIRYDNKHCIEQFIKCQESYRKR